MFEQRRYPSAKEMLPDKVRAGLTEDQLVVLCEPTDLASDQRNQVAAYRAIGFQRLHSSEDGAFLVINKADAEAYERAVQEESREMLQMKPQGTTVPGELSDENAQVEMDVNQLFDGAEALPA